MTLFPDESDPFSFKVQSISAEYTVELTAHDGIGQCDCEDWTFRHYPNLLRGGRTHCKHIEACLRHLADSVVKAKVELDRQKEAAREASTDYGRLRNEWIARHQCCALCQRAPEDVHHSRGRLGRLLMDERFWVPLCRTDHIWVHSHPKAAREKIWNGIPILCAAGDWNRLVD